MSLNKFLFIAFFSSILIFSQGHHTNVLDPSVSVSVFHYLPTGSDNLTNAYNYGIYAFYGEIYVSAYKFDLSWIPQNACNIKAKLEAYRSSGSGSGVIDLIANNLDFSNYSWVYGSVSSGSVLFNVDLAQGTQHDITSSLSGSNHINIGVRSDGTNINSGAKISIKLTVTYDLLLSVSFQNEFISVGNGGNITVRGTQYNSPANGFQVTEGDTISGTAQDQTLTAIDYAFYGWYNGQTFITADRSHQFTPSDNTTYTAKFHGTPSVNSMNVTFNYQSTGNNPTIYWTDNENSHVSYVIYRSVLNGFTWSPWAIKAYINKNVQTYTDNTYIISGSASNYQLRLDAGYSIENTTSIAHYCMFGADSRWQEKPNFGNNQLASITEYKLYNNFPNPFNPSTEIYYQIPYNGNVKLKVYNMMGQEVMTLVNGFKEKGMYSATFNAGNLASGLYIYKLEAGNYSQVKKMLLTK